MKTNRCRKFSFSDKLLKQGNRHFIKIPFNLWEECGQKGLIPVKVCIRNLVFECRLVSKGEGFYYIPITKDIVNQIDSGSKIDVSLEIIQSLTRINHDSPYSKEHPIRKIDGIREITYPKEGYCGQICIAMLTGLNVEDIIDRMQAKAWQCSFSRLIETLDYYGISHAEKITYTRGKEVIFPECCIVNVKGDHTSHFVLYYQGKYYDTADFSADKITGYLEIIIE